MATYNLANWAVNLRYEDLPESTVHAAVRSFHNYAGCAIGGSKHYNATVARDALALFFGPSIASLYGFQGTVKTDIQHAALINGIASHVHDYDDTHLETIIHPTGPVASALLAFAENQQMPVSGQDFIVALVAGIEAECKLGLAVWPAHYDVGWHITSTTGSIGAAIATGRLLELTVPKMQHAIGIAATQVTGIREMFGSDTKAFHPGRAAQNGLMAAALADKGYSSSLTALEAKCGWANVLSKDPHTLDREFATLGKVWEVEKNSFKPFPCGIVAHPVIDAAIQLKRELDRQGASVDDIESVKARVHPLVVELTGNRTPADGLQAKFSVYHGAATGLVNGVGVPAQYEDAVVLDPTVVAVRDRIDAEADESIRADETKVTLRLKNGKVLEKHVEHAIGSLALPLTDDQLTRKFMDQATPVVGEEHAKASSDRLWALVDVEDVGDIARTL